MFSEYWLKDFSMSNMSLVSMDVNIKKHTFKECMVEWAVKLTVTIQFD